MGEPPAPGRAKAGGEHGPAWVAVKRGTGDGADPERNRTDGRFLLPYSGLGKLPFSASTTTCFASLGKSEFVIQRR